MVLHPAVPWMYPSERYYYGWYDQPAPSDPSDHQIKSMIVDRLNENEWTKGDDITVDVKKKVVILTGKVSHKLAKRAAGDDSWDTAGVADVSNQLEVAS